MVPEKQVELIPAMIDGQPDGAEADMSVNIVLPWHFGL